MSVLCIHSGTKWLDQQGNQVDPDVGPSPTEGECYNVVDIFTFTEGPYYQLAEIPPTSTHTFIFWHEMFVPVSDIDETELIRQREGVTA